MQAVAYVALVLVSITLLSNAQEIEGLAPFKIRSLI